MGRSKMIQKKNRVQIPNKKKDYILQIFRTTKSQNRLKKTINKTNNKQYKKQGNSVINHLQRMMMIQKIKLNQKSRLNNQNYQNKIIKLKNKYYFYNNQKKVFRWSNLIKIQITPLKIVG
jgi:RecA-family ATPase